MRNLFSHFESAHDRLSSASFVGAQICLFVIVFSYSYEVVSRYFFAAPTWWSNEVVAYALCIGTFLALPQVTRDGGNIAITFLIDALPPHWARIFNIGIAIVGAFVCLAVAWICLMANMQHYLRNEMIVRVRPIPKFWISVWITYGFFSAGLHFARMAIPRRAAAEAA